MSTAEIHRSVAPSVVEHRTSRKGVWLTSAIIAVLAAGFALYWFKFRPNAASTGTAAGGGRGAMNRDVPVVTASSRMGDFNIYLTGLGTVAPFNTVTVRSRVDGQVNTVAFTEGQFVHEGDLVAEIDPRPFQVQLEQAEGQMIKDQAQLNNAKANVQRDREAKDAISAQQLDTDVATMNQYEGAVKIDQGQIDSAKLQLTYCKITAPISGRIGFRQVDQGNIVHASDATGLAVITQLQPIAVLFSLQQENISAVLRKTHAGETLAVDAYDRELKNKLAAGTLLAADNQIDPTTGMLRFKAQFENQDFSLFPNQFVNARLLIDTLKSVVLVPNAAVQHGLQSDFIYVVKPDGTVEMRNVTVGPTEGNDTVITDGLKPGETLVTDGVDKLQDGSKVTLAQGENGPTTRPHGMTGGGRRRNATSKPST